MDNAADETGNVHVVTVDCAGGEVVITRRAIDVAHASETRIRELGHTAGSDVSKCVDCRARSARVTNERVEGGVTV